MKNVKGADKPHDSYDTGKWVMRQGMPTDRYGHGARSDKALPDRGTFGDIPDVGRARAQNEYGCHHVLAHRLAPASKALTAWSLWKMVSGLRTVRDDVAETISGRSAFSYRREQLGSEIMQELFVRCVDVFASNACDLTGVE